MNAKPSAAVINRAPQAAELAPGPTIIPARRMIVNWALFLMLWGGYNTQSYRAFQPEFPTNTLDLFHGLRALFPFVAALFALIKLLARRPLPLWPMKGPLGLIGLYTLVGAASSVLLSNDPAEALWWAGQYTAVLLVVWAVLADTDPLQRVSRVVELNWVIVGVIAAGFLTAIALTPNLELRPGGLLQFKSEGRNESEDLVFGMATSRSTGVARYAAIAGITAFGKIWRGKRQFRIAWLFIFLATVTGIVYLKARTEALALLAGGFGLLWLRRGSKLHLVLAGFGALVLLGLTGSYAAFWNWLTRGQAFDVTLTGRTLVWADGWDLFLQSPLLGLGFHADRIFLNVHMHDAMLHAMVQSGLLGAIPFMAALVSAWVLIYHLYVVTPPQGVAPAPPEIPGVIAFFTVASISESTFAFFGVAWLLVAPCLAYLQALGRERQALGLLHASRRSPRFAFRRPGWAASSARPRGSHSTP